MRAIAEVTNRVSDPRRIIWHVPKMDQQHYPDFVSIECLNDDDEGIVCAGNYEDVPEDLSDRPGESWCTDCLRVPAP